METRRPVLNRRHSLTRMTTDSSRPIQSLASARRNEDGTSRATHYRLARSDRSAKFDNPNAYDVETDSLPTGKLNLLKLGCRIEEHNPRW